MGGQMCDVSLKQNVVNCRTQKCRKTPKFVGYPTNGRGAGSWANGLLLGTPWCDPGCCNQESYSESIGAVVHRVVRFFLSLGRRRRFRETLKKTP